MQTSGMFSFAAWPNSVNYARIVGNLLKMRLDNEREIGGKMNKRQALLAFCYSERSDFNQVVADGELNHIDRCFQVYFAHDVVFMRFHRADTHE